MGPITLFLCGDVMTGRGIDQVLPHPVNAAIHEPYVTSALDYVALAEEVSGPIPRPVDFAYVWGDALSELERRKADLRLVNLETAVTISEDYLPKGINYRMHPANTPCLTAAKIDGCSLANNHILDWGRSGLIQTRETLEKAGIKAVGAGRELAEAQSAALFHGQGGTLALFGFGSVSSGIPASWAATPEEPGVNLLTDYSPQTVNNVASLVARVKGKGVTVVASIHWGANWGYRISPEERRFAHDLIDHAGVDVVHGHSSHHVKGIEVYRGRPVLYGCGDFINDYEGISGNEEYRGDLGLMYFLTMESGELRSLEMVPTQIRCFRVNRAPESGARWLRDTINREGKALGTSAWLNEDNTLSLVWE